MRNDDCNCTCCKRWKKKFGGMIGLVQAKEKNIVDLYVERMNDYNKIKHMNKAWMLFIRIFKHH